MELPVLNSLLAEPKVTLRARRSYRILLVKPDISDLSVGFTSLARVAPLDILMVAASVPEHTCQLIDMRLEPDEAFERVLAEFQPEIVGMTAYTAEAEAAKSLCRRAKAMLPECVVVIGGYHATMDWEDALAEPAIDYAVIGEGEETFPELLAYLSHGKVDEASLTKVEGIAFRGSGGIVVTHKRAQLQDLDELPFPRWELVAPYQHEYYLNVMGTMASVETTRGCPFDCSFCSVWVFNSRRYRKKSPERVIEELRRLPSGIQVVAFVDDEFWVDEKRSMKLANLIDQGEGPWKEGHWKFWAQVRTDDITRNPHLVPAWSKVGMKVLLLGIESHKDEELKVLHHKRNTVDHAITALKTMRESGVEAWGCFIVNPEWAEEDFHDLMNFVNANQIAFPQFTVLTPLPGTELTKQMVARGLLDLSTLRHELLDFLHATTRTTLPLTRFYELLAELYEKTSMGANLGTYRRAVRNGVISRDFLQSEMGKRVTGFFGQLTRVEAYIRAHQMLGQDVTLPAGSPA